MNGKFKEYRDGFVKDNFFSKGAEIKVEEYTKYTNDEKMNIFVEKSADETRYYKKDIFELSDEELDLGIKMESYKVNEQMNNKLSTIKGIMIFWVVLTIISLVASIYLVSN